MPSGINIPNEEAKKQKLLELLSPISQALLDKALPGDDVPRVVLARRHGQPDGGKVRPMEKTSGDLCDALAAAERRVVAAASQVAQVAAGQVAEGQVAAAAGQVAAAAAGQVAASPADQAAGEQQLYDALAALIVFCTADDGNNKKFGEWPWCYVAIGHAALRLKVGLTLASMTKFVNQHLVQRARHLTVRALQTVCVWGASHKHSSQTKSMVYCLKIAMHAASVPHVDVWMRAWMAGAIHTAPTNGDIDKHFYVPALQSIGDRLLRRWNRYMELYSMPVVAPALEAPVSTPSSAISTPASTSRLASLFATQCFTGFLERLAPDKCASVLAHLADVESSSKSSTPAVTGFAEAAASVLMLPPAVAEPVLTPDSIMAVPISTLVPTVAPPNLSLVPVSALADSAPLQHIAALVSVPAPMSAPTLTLVAATLPVTQHIVGAGKEPNAAAEPTVGKETSRVADKDTKAPTGGETASGNGDSGDANAKSVAAAATPQRFELADATTDDATTDDEMPEDNYWPEDDGRKDAKPTANAAAKRQRDDDADDYLPSRKQARDEHSPSHKQARPRNSGDEPAAPFTVAATTTVFAILPITTKTTSATLAKKTAAETKSATPAAAGGFAATASIAASNGASITATSTSGSARVATSTTSVASARFDFGRRLLYAGVFN